MSEKLRLKSISELLNEKFNIPSYQRGYRWTKQQVEELLEDIWEFAQDVESNKNTGFYCLQPIVVKRNRDDKNVWDVIDGQQRLTSLYLLLSYLSDVQTKCFGDDTKYEIDYETREGSKEFLIKIKERQDSESNIDFFHMYQAYDTIKNWFVGKNKGDFLNTLLRNEKPNVQIIWYEVEDNQLNEIDIFTRINMGKIPLTNAELIKALLIQGYGITENKDNKQFELASEWDFIEYSLQNDDFWFFINKDKNEKATRIEFIFELIAEKYIKNQKNFASTFNKSIDKYYEFHIINHYLQNGSKTHEEKSEESIHQKLWSEVKNYFRILNEWYEDREFFHKIGFLVIYSGKTMLDFIAKYSEEKFTKKDFRDFLDKQIKEIFKNIIIEELNYDDGESVRKVLLMFNINTILENKESNMRFQFDRYKKQKWDIEHIRSQADKYPRKEEKKTWIDDILKINKPDIEITKDEILNMEDEKFYEFFNAIQKKIEGDDGVFDKHTIGNLTLLDSATNRGYGNAFFPVKRKTIIENDKNGTFIPICTRNVFMKYYTEKPDNLYQWTGVDADKYLQAIKTNLKDFLPEEQNHGN